MTEAQAILNQLFAPLDRAAEPILARLGLERCMYFATTFPPVLSVYAEGRNGEAVNGGAVPFTPEIGAAIAAFLTAGLQTLDDETRRLVAEASNGRRASLAVFADPVQGRARVWLVPTGKTVAQAVALFELRERPTQVH